MLCFTILTLHYSMLHCFHVALLNIALMLDLLMLHYINNAVCDVAPSNVALLIVAPFQYYTI